MLFKVKYNGKSSLSLIKGRIYKVIAKDAFDFWRIIDESGKDYGYTLDEFSIIEDKNNAKPRKSQECRFKT